jgi:hypothetical protein
MSSFIQLTLNDYLPCDGDHTRCCKYGKEKFCLYVTQLKLGFLHYLGTSFLKVCVIISMVKGNLKLRRAEKLTLHNTAEMRV